MYIECLIYSYFNIEPSRRMMRTYTLNERAIALNVCVVWVRGLHAHARNFRSLSHLEISPTACLTTLSCRLAPITHTRSYRLRLKSTTFTATSFFFLLPLKRTCVLVCCGCLYVSVWVWSLIFVFCFAKFPNGSELVFHYLNHI